jgi:hypothetical protein
MRIVDLLEEAQETKNFMEVMNEFLPFVTKELDLPRLPKIKLEARFGSAEQPSFGKFVSEENTIYLAVEDRHPIDIIRTFAHELVHFKQGVEHDLGPDSGNTGSPQENEAHQLAGIVMRNFNKAYPEFFGRPAVNVNRQ